MRGTLILLIFFLMFTAATLLAPFQMFPGNIFCFTIGSIVEKYSYYFGAVFNGLFYGIIVWLMFVGLSRKLEQES